MPASPSSPPRLRRPIRLLLVEDHTDTRLMYAEFLRRFYEIVEAGDGSRALDLARSLTPDVVVTDLSLPHMDGFELIARLRAESPTRRVPVVCLSGYGGYMHEQRARDVGCDRVIQKPCLPDALAEAIGELLSQASHRSSL